VLDLSGHEDHPTRDAAPAGPGAGGPTSTAAAAPMPAAVSVPTLQISVMHGSLECAHFPVLIAHGTGTPLRGAEARCNALMGRRLTELQDLGLYPDVAGSYRFVPSRPGERIRGCIVLALDTTAPLTPSGLSDQVTRAVLDYVDQRRRIGPSPGGPVDSEGREQLGIAAVPIGAGTMFRLGVERSVDAITSGVLRANEILASVDQRHGPDVCPVIGRLEFVDRYAGNVERIMWTLNRIVEQRADDVCHGTIAVEPVALELEGALAGVPSPKYEVGRWEHLSVEVDGSPDPQSPQRLLTYRFARDRAAVSDTPRRVDRTVAADLLREAVADPARTTAVGAVLYEQLLPVELKDELSRIDSLVLQVDELTADLPWETFVDRLAADLPLACRVGLLRQFRSRELRATPGRKLADSALVFGDPPTGSLRLPAASDEARAVAGRLAATGIAVTLLDFEDEALGEASARRIHEALWSRDYRIVHIASHGFYRVPGAPRGAQPSHPSMVEGGVAIGEGSFLTADDFRNLRVAPELVFLNCCNLGQLQPEPEPERDAGRVLDPAEHNDLAASVAYQLMSIGVNAVVVAGWPVVDDVAALFAERFYAAMLDGVPYGDAVKMAREETYRLFGDADNTWAAYQCYGDPGFQLRIPIDEAPPAENGIQVRATGVQLLREVIVQTGEVEDPSTLAPRLRLLDGAIEKTWPGDGELLSLRGRAFGDLGLVEEAIERYEAAIHANDGGASVKTIEQLVVLLSSAAVACQRADRLEEAADRISRAQKWLAVLSKLNDTGERRAIDGGVLKRMAILNPARRSELVLQAIASYGCAATSSASAAQDVGEGLYGFRNAIQLAAIANPAADEVDSLLAEVLDPRWITRWAVDACRPPEGTFYERVGPADSALSAAVVQPASALASRLVELIAEERSRPESERQPLDQLAELLRANPTETINGLLPRYRAARSGGVQALYWRSVVDHLYDLRDLTSGRMAKALDKLAVTLSEPGS
jgi:CHAT domain-containing protein